MKEINEKYILVLEEILNNVEGLKKTSKNLLENELNEKNKKQYQAIHAQFFFYICLEELGKFFMLVKNYPNNFKDLDELYKNKSQKHNEKIEILIDYIKKYINENGGKKELPSSKEIAKKLRGIKEPNIYIDYKNNKLFKPVPNKGNGVLDNIAKIIFYSLELAKIEFNKIKINH